jgi:hypothetical protein
MPDSHVSTGRILSISSRGRITLDVDGRLVIGQLLDGGGGWVGDRVEGAMHPGLQLWRHVGSAIVSHVQVLLTECAALIEPGDENTSVTARAA